MGSDHRNHPPILYAQELREERLIHGLGPHLRRVIEYLHGPDDGLAVVLKLARRFEADQDTTDGIALYYQRLTEQKAGALLFLGGVENVREGQ